MGSSDSSSQANQTTRTSNLDNRVVTEQGNVATGQRTTANTNSITGGIKASGGSTITVERMDAEIVNRAIEETSAGLSKLMDMGGAILEGGAKMIEKKQEEESTQLNQKTIVILGGAVALTMAAMSLKKRG